MAAQRIALLLAAAACLAVSASAARAAPGPAAGGLPTFKNPGGPPFLDGPSYHWNYTTNSIVTMGITFGGNYSFAYVSDGGITTELGVYTSWECGKEKGSYYAIVELKELDVDGNILSESTACEYGFVYDADMRNTWAQSPDSCPTKVEQENRFLGEREFANQCGDPGPFQPADSPTAGQEGSLADQLADDLAEAPTPSSR